MYVQLSSFHDGRLARSSSEAKSSNVAEKATTIKIHEIANCLQK